MAVQTNQSVHVSIKQSISQSINQYINQYNNQSIQASAVEAFASARGSRGAC
jgi:hypothetical protein